MNNPSFARSLWSNRTLNYALMIAATFVGALSFAAYQHDSALVTPLLLGIIAGALAETEDSFWGRIRAITLTFICFGFASWSTAILFPYPWVFAIGLLISTFGFVMLGSIGPRYSSIAFGSLLIAIYTMLGMDTSEIGPQQTFLMLAGAGWYYLVSLVWQMLWPQRPVQQSIGMVFDSLGHYLETKCRLFVASEDLTPQPILIEEARLNSVTVSHLEHCKTLFNLRSKKGIVDGPSDRFLRLYFLAQDVHERISSTHYRYQDLAAAFGRSDVLFRFQQLLEHQAKACFDAANAIRSNQAFSYRSSPVIRELKRSLDFIEHHSQSQQKELLPQLHYLFKNLTAIEQQLHNISNPDAIALSGSSALDDDQPKTIRAMLARVSNSLSLNSPLCRHAIRLSLALTCGYVVIQLANLSETLSLSHGYWVLLTTLFVCQPNFSATKQKLVSRIVGTITGLAAGSLLLTLLPTQLGHMVVITLSAVLFFTFRRNNYSYATAFITVLVLFCFEQLGEGFVVIMPRLADTLIGSAIAAIAVMFVLPDWQAKRLPQSVAKAIEANLAYLDQTIAQYRVGKEDGLAYRIARRDAHFADAQLSTAISNMLMEPERHQFARESYFRLLTLNHALLSYISTLGSHRERLDDESVHTAILRAHANIRQHLTVLGECAAKQHTPPVYTNNDVAVGQHFATEALTVSMVLQQMHLIHRMLPELYSLVTTLQKSNMLTKASQ